MPAKWKTYVINHLDSDGKIIKRYVGVTERSLKGRLTAHLGEASRGVRSISSYSLGYAIRQEVAALGAKGRSRFEIVELSRHSSSEDASAAEARSVADLNTKAPHGYNVMPGGSSLGSKQNTKQITLFVDGNMREFPSIREAAVALAEAAMIDPEAFVNRVYFRLKSKHWTLAEAFDLEPHQDRRSTALSREAAETGVKLDTLRSKQQRERLKEMQAPIPRGTRLPHPTDSECSVSIEEFARLTGVSVSTVNYRLKAVMPVHEKTTSELLSALLQDQDRRVLWDVTVDGITYTLGQNALAKAFCKAGTIKSGRYSWNTIRKNFGALAATATNEERLQALGLMEKPSKDKLVVVEPIRIRKLRFDDWSIMHRGAAVPLAKQMDFVRWTLARSRHDLGGERDLQKRVTALAKKGMVPWEIAATLGVDEVSLST